MTVYQENVEVLWNKKVGPGYYRIGLTCHRGYVRAKPGQFIMLRFPDRMVPLLRRPFSIHRPIVSEGGLSGIEVLYKVIGEGTRRLSKCNKGDIVDILGPLGNGFSFFDHYNRIYIVAGGIGVAPMLYLATTLLERGVDPSGCQVFLGGKSKDDLLCQDDFAEIGVAVHITTDDGSSGDQCFVTDPLQMASESRRPDIIYACGPLEMLSCVIGIAEKNDIPCQVSVETIMACGIGACLGCAVARKDSPEGYMHACMDGPVFDAQLLSLNRKGL